MNEILRYKMCDISSIAIEEVLKQLEENNKQSLARGGVIYDPAFINITVSLEFTNSDIKEIVSNPRMKINHYDEEISNE